MIENIQIVDVEGKKEERFSSIGNAIDRIKHMQEKGFGFVGSPQVITVHYKLETLKDNIINLLGDKNSAEIIDDMFKIFRRDQLEAMVENEITLSFMDRWIIAERIAKKKLSYDEADSIIEGFYQAEVDILELAI